MSRGWWYGLTARERLTWGVRAVVSRTPALYLPYSRLRSRELTLHPQTQLVIEGPPRSGNTFAVYAFAFAQEAPPRVAHHRHAAAQVVAAVRREVPAIVLLRDPDDVALSYVLRSSGRVSVRRALYDYVAFYAPLLDLRSGFVLGTFDEVTSRFGDVIDRVNERFGTSFSRFEHTPENERRCFDAIDSDERDERGRTVAARVARPSSEREEMKRTLRPELEDHRLHDLRASARRLHDAFAPDAVASGTR